MTVQHQKTTAQPSAPHSLARLRVREAALRHQATQLQARAEHLDRVGRAHAQQLQRRIDAHEKIVLGALVKKAGLDIPQSEAHQPPNDDDSTPLRGGLTAQSTAYDRALILGALLWLEATLNQPENDVVSVPNRQRLRNDGLQALKKTKR
jgi:hypothetical protein